VRSLVVYAIRDDSRLWCAEVVAEVLDVDAEFLGDEVAGAGIPTALGFVFNSSRHLDSYTEWEFEREELTIDWATEKIPKWTATAGNVSGVQMKTRFRERISRSIAARIRLAVIVLVWLAFLLLAHFVLISRYEEAACNRIRKSSSSTFAFIRRRNRQRHIDDVAILASWADSTD